MVFQIAFSKHFLKATERNLTVGFSNFIKIISCPLCVFIPEAQRLIWVIQARKQKYAYPNTIHNIVCVYKECMESLCQVIYISSVNFCWPKVHFCWFPGIC